MGNLRIKIAAFALAVGLGGLGGYAMSSNKNPQANSPVLAEGTKVVRRTVHAKRSKAQRAAVHQARAAATGEARSRLPAGLHRLERLRVLLGIEQQPAGQHRQQRLVGRRLQPATRLDRVERRRLGWRRRRGGRRRRRARIRRRLSASRQTLPKS